ncbi:hypothetical protein [Streptomyces sp. NPDC002132]|uniref:hypothetical protein n=1 Tax=unclassified Streptomyces TaxID=2593676 RepID=UPI0033269C5B
MAASAAGKAPTVAPRTARDDLLVLVICSLPSPMPNGAAGVAPGLGHPAMAGSS